jgi:hypothetical protein
MNENMPINELSSSQKGISNTTIAVLIILALVITIIGTLAVLDSTSSSRITVHDSTTNVGKVSLQILPPETPSTENVVANTSS